MMRHILTSGLAALILIAGVGATSAQQPTPTKQKTQDGNSPTTVGPASGAYKQKTDGGSLPMVGPASGAYKQNTQADGPTTVGPASGAYKRN